MNVDDFVNIVEKGLCYGVRGVQACFVVSTYLCSVDKRYYVIGVGIPGADGCINMDETCILCGQSVGCIKGSVTLCRSLEFCTRVDISNQSYWPVLHVA